MYLVYEVAGISSYKINSINCKETAYYIVQVFAMNTITVDSSSDEDDPYTNSVARLRTLKKQRIEREELSSKKSIEQQTNVEDLTGNDINDKDLNGEDFNGKEINAEDIHSEETSYGIQTRNGTVRARRNKQISTRAVRRRTRGRCSPIDLDCDVEIVREETSKSTLKSCENDIISLSDDDAYNEDDNYEINIKVYWRSNRIDRLSMLRHDSFKGIFQYYADLEKVSVNEILIMKKDKIINPTDTPASLKLSIIDILDGGIVNPGINTPKNESNDEDICTIKVQTANKKQFLTIPLKKDERFKVLFANCADQLGVKEKNLKFYFDGEQISSTDTPESLDLEREACVDLHIST